jgi:hypothetical protein
VVLLEASFGNETFQVPSEKETKERKERDFLKIEDVVSVMASFRKLRRY